MMAKKILKNKVSIVKTEQGIEEAITEAMDLVDWKSCIEQHGRVVIKPNMGNLTYVPAIITRPDVIHYVVKIIKTWANDVIVGESDGTHYECDEAFIRTGVKDAVESAGGRIINFSHDEQVKVPVDGLRWQEVVLPKTIVDADSFITLPVIKTHETTLITCALKNQFGCIANRYRCLYHKDLHTILADINMAINPDLVITDGTYCMEGNGPIHGPVKELGIVIASDNVVANDLVVAKIMGVDYKEVKHLYNAMTLGVGRYPAHIVGIPLDSFNNVTFKPVNLDTISKILVRVTANPLLCRTLLLSPLFPALQKITWLYRGWKGVERRT